MLNDVTTGTRQERETRIDYLLSQKRALQLQAAKNKRLGFEDEPILFLKQMHLLPSQSYGSRIEAYYKERFGLESVSVHEKRGDCRNQHGCHFEMKVSYKSASNSYNFIQIRPWQNLEGYCIITIDPDDGYEMMFFYLTREQMDNEVALISNLAHGDTDLKKIALKAGSSDWKRWVKNYRVPTEAIMGKIMTKEPMSDEKRVYFGKQYFRAYTRKVRENIAGTEG